MLALIRQDAMILQSLTITLVDAAATLRHLDFFADAISFIADAAAAMLIRR